MTNHIFLTGFMGAGKSTLGMALAERLGYPLLDTDEWIERESGKTIPDLFREAGEAAFRAWETKALSYSLNQGRAIVSTGGGLPCFHDHSDRMLAYGTVFYLDLPAHALAKRLRGETSKRPLIPALKEEELTAYIIRKLCGRLHFYEQADWIVDANRPLDIILDEVMGIISPLPPKCP